MSGSFEQIDVPPALISFATALTESGHVVSPEFKRVNSRVVLLAPEYDADGLPKAESLCTVFDTVSRLIRSGDVLSAWASAYGGVAEGIFKMCLGNGLGFELDAGADEAVMFGYRYGAFILELAENAADTGSVLGRTISEYELRHANGAVALDEIEQIYQGRLESVFPCNAPTPLEDVPSISYTDRNITAPALKTTEPKVLIPVFPGTNCEYETARAFEQAGAKTKTVIVRNLTPSWLAASIEQLAAEIAEAQIIALPGGSSCGDEPDGSAKFIANFFRSPAVKEALADFLECRGGLMCGIGNGFQALIKLGLLPFGAIRDIDGTCPSLTANTICRNQSRLIQKRVSSTLSPWLGLCEVGDIHTVAVSHAEGRFICPPDLFNELASKGQIAAQYVDLTGRPTMDPQYNPSGSYMAAEAVTSPDGRIFGQMSHPERYGAATLQNVPGNKDFPLFGGAVRYFK